jgi:polyketide synthase PksN
MPHPLVKLPAAFDASTLQEQVLLNHPEMRQLKLRPLSEYSESTASQPVPVEKSVAASIPIQPEEERTPVRIDPLPVQAVELPDEPAWVSTSVPASHVEVLAQLQFELLDSFAEALYMKREDVDIDKPFAEMGLDSITGVEWVRALNERYRLTLSATRLYEYPTIRTLAQWAADASVSEESARSVPAAVVPVPVSAAPQGTEMDAEDLPSPVVPQENTSPARKVPAPEGGVRHEIPEARIPMPAPAPAATSQVNPSADRRLYDGAIAIVGMSARYPGAGDLQAYWTNLRESRNSVREIPSTRWDIDHYYDPEKAKAGKTYCRYLGSLDEIACFDPLFFGISPAEAECMDPQQRIFLQESYRAFEDAGYSPRQLSNTRCGVYLGIMANEYGSLLPSNEVSAAQTTGNSASIAAARIAYHLNLKGPAIPIDTACSSSLVATHLACQALRTGEIDMALAGGVTLYLTPQFYLGMCSAGMLSPEGQCKTFDNSANGFVPGEGVGAVVLKRLEDAEKDGDCIHGLIIGSGINQDGKTNGITAPSLERQKALCSEVYDRWRIDPGSISYVEMHGTGTKLGDPIELEALAGAFRQTTQRRGFCAVGSVKSNIGHTSAAAGVAGIHKVLLALRHRELVPTLNYAQPNEQFDFDASPFYVNTELREWSSPPGQPRRAAVSSFGFSGTNAHLVIEEYLLREPVPTAWRGPVVVALSARNAERLQDRVLQLLARLQDESLVEVDLARVAYTFQVSREPMSTRLACVVNSFDDLRDKLARYSRGDARIEGLYRGEVQRIGNFSALTGDEDMQFLVENWAKKGKFGKLAELWTQGFNVDWMALYGPIKPVRISLPAYPFAREPYWFPKLAASPGTAAVVSSRQDHAVPADGNFDASFFTQLIDQVATRSLTIEAALEKSRARDMLISDKVD